ncbi:MAG: galactokinase [Anaerolineae bacterium]|nr:galactokinase [Anaerolineae bacterium]
MSGNTPTQELATIVQESFHKHFGYSPSHVGFAPGRVNLIGEHTDYNDGFVLPAAIDKAVYVAARLGDDRTINLVSLDYEGSVSFSLDQLQDHSLPAWSRYPRGVPFILSQMGAPLRGMDLVVAGNVPRGGGFSSSAAIEVALIEVITALLAMPLTQAQKALLGVRVEHEFVGIPCGIMDQMISAVGQVDHAILIDCRTQETTPVPIPSGVSIITLDTGTRRELVEGEYGARRRQCEEAAAALGIKALRDIDPVGLIENLEKLPAPPQPHRMRALHAVHENARTLKAVEALRQGDMDTMGKLMNLSHISLSDLYEVSIKELDIMAYLAQREPQCFGARMMGGGFGGAVIALVEDSAAESFAERVTRSYQRMTGRTPAAFVAKAGRGSGVITL